MIPAAEAVHAANPDTLIFLSGLNYDTDIAPLVMGQSLGGGYRFDVGDFKFADKLVFELHDYSWDQTFSNCSVYDADLMADGFSVVDMWDDQVRNRLPIVLTEFGFAPEDYTELYAQCIKNFIIRNHIGWTMWDVSGSYYIRQGIQNFNETWGRSEPSDLPRTRVRVG